MEPKTEVKFISRRNLNKLSMEYAKLLYPGFPFPYSTMIGRGYCKSVKRNGWLLYINGIQYFLGKNLFDAINSITTVLLLHALDYALGK